MRPMNKLWLGVVFALAACGEPHERSSDTADVRQEETIIAPVDSNPTEVEVLNTDREVPVVVMLGDSLTAGFGLPSRAALPEVLSRAFAETGQDVTVINAGVSGDTTGGGLARYDWSVGSQDPDILVIALGANDYLQGVDPNITRSNLTALLERAQGDGLKVLLVGVAPRSEPGHDARAEAYVGIYPELAEAYGVTLLPAMLEGVRDQPELLQSDGLHPTAEGVEIMARPIKAALTALLEGLAE